jgi:hypothetical protein
MGVWWRIKTLSPLAAKRARNRSAIRTLIRTHVDGPLVYLFTLPCANQIER